MIRETRVLGVLPQGCYQSELTVTDFHPDIFASQSTTSTTFTPSSAAPRVIPVARNQYAIYSNSSNRPRAAVNRANAQHSTGPRTEAGKLRASLNALRHGLTARTAVLASEDPAAFEQHCRQFRDEYQPANATETQLVQELADTSWRLNRIPPLEADLFAAAPSPELLVPALASLGLHSSRLSRQFQKTLDQLRAIQYDRRHQERRDLRDAADILEFRKYKGIPWDPADDGFVFTKNQVDRHAQRLMRQIEAQHIGAVRFDIPPRLLQADD